MAFGSNNLPFDPGTKAFYFRIKDKGLPAPIFRVQRREGDKFIDLPDATRVSGSLIGLRNKQFTYQGSVIKQFSATLRDKDEIYFISIPSTFLGRSIVNSLLNLEKLDGVEVGLYKSNPKPPQGKTFSSAFVKQNGTSVYGKYERKDLPAIPKVEIGGQKISDTSAIEAFFAKEVDLFEKSLEVSSPVVVNANHESSTAESSAESSDEDVPF